MQTARINGNNNSTVQLQIVDRCAQLELTRFIEHRHAAGSTPRPLDRLLPYSRSSTLRGREDALCALDQFIRSSDRPLSIRVMTGTGGSGKTRLALELCERWATRGWEAGFATSGKLDQFFAHPAYHQWTWDKPTLLVIDYAGVHAARLKDWLEELAKHARKTSEPNHRLRILLLERQANMEQGWMKTLFNAGNRSDTLLQAVLDPPEPISLPAITSIEDRTGLLNEMLGQFGRSDLRFEAEEVEQQLRDSDWQGDPLFLMMAAAHAADTGSLQVLRLGRTDMAGQIAKAENARLTTLAERHQPPLSQKLLCHLAACVTLAQGRNHADLLTLTNDERIALGRAAQGDNADYADLLCDALPDPQTQGAAPILPDLIGEAFVLDHFGAERQRSLDADLLRLIQTLRAPMAHTLVRCAQDFIQYHPEPDQQAPLSWMSSLVSKAAKNQQVLDDIAVSIPLETVILRRLKLQVELTRHQAQVTSPPLSDTERAHRLNALGIAHMQMGEVAAAIQAMQQAVDLSRSSCGTSLENILSLADHLTNLCHFLCNSYRYKDAQIAIEDAVEIYRRADLKRPTDVMPRLANSLNSLSICRTNLSQHVLALAAAEESNQLWVELERKHPAIFLHHVAASLDNIAVILSKLGQPKPALEANERALERHRRLAQHHPDAYRLYLAKSLINITNRFSDIGKKDEALSNAKEAVDLCRQLYRQQPAALGPTLAKALNNLANRLGKCDQKTCALSAIEESTELYEKLVEKSHFTAYVLDLAGSLNNLSNRLEELGQDKERALSASQRAVDLLRKRTGQRPKLWDSTLATFLSNLANRLGDCGHDMQALTTAQEAINLWQKISLQRSGNYAQGQAQSLSALGRALARMDRLPEAATKFREAIAVLLPMFRKNTLGLNLLMSSLRDNYIQLSNTAGQPIDEQLLAPVIDIFQQLHASSTQPSRPPT